MRVFFVFLLAISFIGSALSPRAADYTATPQSKTEKKVMTQKNYTARDLEEETPSSQDTVDVAPDTGEQIVTECTKEDRRKLEEYDKTLVSYYEDSKFVSENQDKFESTKELEGLQKNMDVYMDFLESEDYGESIRLRQLCNSPAPPRPYEWPVWMPLPDPMDVENPAPTPQE